MDDLAGHVVVANKFDHETKFGPTMIRSSMVRLYYLRANATLVDKGSNLLQKRREGVRYFQG